MRLTAVRQVSFCLALILFGGPIQAAEKTWLKESGGERSTAEISDFYLHFLAGMSSALLVSALTFPVIKTGDHLSTSLAVSGIGLSSSVLAGAIKELMDLSGFGTPEWKDLFSTVLGGAVASSLIFTLSYLAQTKSVDQGGASLLLGSYGLVFMFPVANAWMNRKRANSIASTKNY